MFEELHLKEPCESQSPPPTMEAENTRYLLLSPCPTRSLQPGFRHMALVCLFEAGIRNEAVTVPNHFRWQRASSGVWGGGGGSSNSSFPQHQPQQCWQWENLGGARTVVLIRTPLWVPGLINLIFHPSANGKFTKDLQ